MRDVAAAPKLSAIGSAPSAVAKLVIKIGRKRCEAASNTASFLANPSVFCYWQIQQLKSRF